MDKAPDTLGDIGLSRFSLFSMIEHGKINNRYLSGGKLSTKGRRRSHASEIWIFPI